LPRFGNDQDFKDPFADENSNIDKLVGKLVQPTPEEKNNQMLSNDDSFSHIASADPAKEVDQVAKAANDIDPSNLKEKSISKDMLKKDK